jgi:hypothetical protein
MELRIARVIPEKSPRTTPFDKALPSIAERLWTGLGGLIPAYTEHIPLP